jgi:hypothetical protein
MGFLRRKADGGLNTTKAAQRSTNHAAGTSDRRGSLPTFC